MFAHERHAEILRRLSGRPRYGVTQLAQALNVSRSTLRRDLLELEQRGEVIRVHGGVMHPQYLRGETTFERRSGENVAAKRRIAQFAASLVEPNSTVYLDAGSTPLEVGRLLLMRDDLKLFTHSVAMLAAAQDAAATIACIGGELRGVSGALVGGLALEWLARLRFDTCFIGASGLHGQDGPSTTELHEAALKQTVLERSAKRVLVCDASKCQAPANVNFAGWGRFTHWAVDRAAPVPLRKAVRSAGIEIVLT